MCLAASQQKNQSRHSDKHVGSYQVASFVDSSQGTDVIPAAAPAQHVTDAIVILSAADEAARRLDSLKSHVVTFLSKIPVQVQTQRHQVANDIHGDMTQLQVCILRIRHMAASCAGGGSRVSTGMVRRSSMGASAQLSKAKLNLIAGCNETRALDRTHTVAMPALLVSIQALFRCAAAQGLLLNIQMIVSFHALALA